MPHLGDLVSGQTYTATVQILWRLSMLQYPSKCTKMNFNELYSFKIVPIDLLLKIKL